jgi:hypothetical protein
MCRWPQVERGAPRPTGRSPGLTRLGCGAGAPSRLRGQRPVVRRLRGVGSKRRAASPVRVRRHDPGTGWSLDQARRLLDQGYTIEHVEARTGWPRPMLVAPPSRRPTIR